MSRIGKLPITIPEGVKVTIAERQVTAEGPKGQLVLRLPQGVSIEQTDGQLLVSKIGAATQPNWGLARSLVANLVEGVSQGFSKQLEIQGVGYRAQLTGSTLTLNLGFSSPSEYKLPAGIEAKVESNIITISGADKQQVGQVAAEIRDLRRPEPYKGKGIRYVGEQVRRKAGKAAAKAGAQS